MKIKYLGKCLLVEELDERILVVGDLHLGYEESLNRVGVFVGRKMYDKMIREFEEIFGKTGKLDKIILLGDVKHEFGRILKQENNDVLKLLDYLKERCKEVVVIKGNHDAIIEPIAKKREIEVLKLYKFGRFCFLHGDKDFEEIYDKKINYWVVAHAHPAIRLTDGVKEEKYKCFLVGKYKDKDVVIVPSFFELSIGTDPRDRNLGLVWEMNLNSFEVIVVETNLNVLKFGKLGKIN